MSFLAPLFLLGGAAIALPIIFHLIQRTTREQTIFSSLIFLLPSPPRLTRRSRLENILLLLLRCAVLFLLALGFARPFIVKPVSNTLAKGSAKRQIILVDTSASMRRPNLWSDAQARAEALLRQASPDDEVALFSFDRQLNPLMTFEQWNQAAASDRVALALDRLKSSRPGWGSTHLGNAVIAAAESLADTAGKRPVDVRQIVLLSDMQEGSHLDQLQGYEWPKGIELALEPLKARSASNASLQLVTDLDETDTNATPTVRIKVANSPGSQREQFEVSWAAGTNQTLVDKPVKVYVPPGQSRVLAIPGPTNSLPVDHLVLKGDDEDYDNCVFVVPPEKERLSVLYVGNENPADTHQPLYFLERALQETRQEQVKINVHKAGLALSPNDLQAASLIVVAEPLGEEEIRAFTQAVASGKTLLALIRSAAQATFLAGLLGVNHFEVSEADTRGYAMLAQIDFRHPIFAPFADPRFSDFTKIHFWKHRKVSLENFPQARRLASFDGGDPALLEVPVSKGRVLILTSGWHPEDSQLALSTKFVPLLYSLLELNGANPFRPIQYFVGDVIPLAGQSEPSQGLIIRAPDGSELKLTPGQTNFSQTTMPGIYRVASTQPEKTFAVNLDGAESRTVPLPLDEFERLGAPLARAPTSGLSPDQKRQIHLQNAELENRQKLWRWLLAGTLTILLLETWLAGRTTRKQMSPAQAVS